MNESLQKIIVHEADKSTGRRKQLIEIVFNFVDQVEIPILTDSVIAEVPEPKENRVTMNVTWSPQGFLAYEQKPL